MKLKRVHRGISFYQLRWMEPHIQKNTELRKQSTKSFEKDFFKLMNNSVFLKNNRKNDKTKSGIYCCKV